MKIKLTYFKDSGKLYETGEHEFPCAMWPWDVSRWVRASATEGKLPGLSSGGWVGCILVEYENDAFVRHLVIIEAQQSK